MSNVELARRFWGLWSDEGLPELIERYDEFFTDDLEWRSPIAEVSGARLLGREAFERHVADLIEAFGEIRAEPAEIAELTPDAVRCKVWVHGRGLRSGAVIDSPLISVARMREGRIAWAWGSFDLVEGERMVEAVARGERVAI